MIKINKISKQPSPIPKEICIDKTLSLLFEGYLYIANRNRRFQSDLFETRLMGQKVICISGKNAAMLFYDRYWFTRENVIPKRIQRTLFGQKSIQTLVGAPHLHRKLLFLSLMTDDQISKILRIAKAQWHISMKRWEKKEELVLFDELTVLFFRVACKWAEVPLRCSETRKRAFEMSSMIDAFGAIGPRYWKGRYSRSSAEEWAQKMIQDVRFGIIKPSERSALYNIAWFKDLSGKLLSSQIAAVELINILRPITAVATYVTFEALAIHTYPQCSNKLKEGNSDYAECFAQEVRRFYPFGPFLGAKVRQDFNWHNHTFTKGTLVFLDLYGTNHDGRIWDNPNVFIPERFINRPERPYDLIPQGGGDYKKGTRCPGEWITVELMKLSADFLVNHLDYHVPLQDLNVSYRRIPTFPRSKFIINKIKIK